MGFFENFYKITFRIEIEPFSIRVSRKMRLYLDSGI